MKGIIFDFNGTLYWDSQLHYDAWREFSKIIRGYEFTDIEMRDKMFGHTNEDIIEYAIGKKPSKEMVEKYGKEKEALYRKRCLLDMDKFKLEKWFDLDKIVYSDGTIPGKPAPDIFLIAAEKIGLKPSECLVVEDAIAGINSAKSAGIGKIIAIASLEPVEFYQKMEGLEGIIMSFNELDRSLLEIPTRV